MDRAFVLASAGLDRHLAYVALTRHREGVGMYAGQDTFPDFEALAARLGRGRLKASVLDHLGEAPEQAGLPPGDRPMPLLEPRRVFTETAEAIGRAVAEYQLNTRLEPGKPGFGLKAAFTDPLAVATRLREAFARSGHRADATAHLLETEPERFGHLHGLRRRLLGDNRERREARAALPKVVAQVRTLLREWRETYDTTVAQETRERELAQVEIPGLSAAAAGFLAAYRAGSPEAGQALITRALVTEEGQGVMGEFRAVTKAATERAWAKGRGLSKYSFIGIPGMDKARSEALGETIVAVQTIEREGRRIVAEQERAEIRLELQRDQERAWRRELDRGSPGLEL